MMVRGELKRAQVPRAAASSPNPQTSSHHRYTPKGLGDGGWLIASVSLANLGQTPTHR